jgi:hypothetical protein
MLLYLGASDFRPYAGVLGARTVEHQRVAVLGTVLTTCATVHETA